MIIRFYLLQFQGSVTLYSVRRYFLNSIFSASKQRTHIYQRLHIAYSDDIDDSLLNYGINENKVCGNRRNAYFIRDRTRKNQCVVFGRLFRVLLSKRQMNGFRNYKKSSLATRRFRRYLIGFNDCRIMSKILCAFL